MAKKWDKNTSATTAAKQVRPFLPILWQMFICPEWGECKRSAFSLPASSFWGLSRHLRHYHGCGQGGMKCQQLLWQPEVGAATAARARNKHGRVCAARA